MKWENIIFITGMFRSGTTLLAKMVNAHKDISIASDPLMPFFKFFRTQKAIDLGLEKLKITYETPLQDYYFSLENLKLLEEIQNSSLYLKFNKNDYEMLLNYTKSNGEPFCPLIMPHLDKITGENYKDIFLSFMNLIEAYYGREGDKYIGFKDVWTDEFIKVLINTFDNVKSIQIIRDPRAVCASKKAQEDNYPWLFLARQWRKLATIALKNQQDLKLKDKVILLYYEDLIKSPEETAKKICTFLNVSFDENMIDPRQYINGEGNPWKQNTSYGEGKIEFNQSSIDKWKETLTKEEIYLIEILCSPEMELHKYIKESKYTDIPNEFLFTAPKIENKKLAQWIQKFVYNDSLHIAIEMFKEKMRYTLLKMSEQELNIVDTSTIKGCFLFVDIFKKIRGEF